MKALVLALLLGLYGCGSPAPKIVVQQRLVPCPPEPVRHECEPTLPKPQGPEMADYLDLWDLEAPLVLKCWRDTVHLWETANQTCREGLDQTETP